MMKEKKDYFSYLLGVASIFLALISFFTDENQKIVFLILGAVGMVVALIMIYVGEFLHKLSSLQNDIENLKR